MSLWWLQHSVRSINYCEGFKFITSTIPIMICHMNEKGLLNEIKPVPLDIIREFLMDDVECVRPSPDWIYSESITFEVCAIA